MYYVTMADGKSYYVSDIHRFCLFDENGWIKEQNGTYLQVCQIVSAKYIQ